jgi:hypothetical protein
MVADGALSLAQGSERLAEQSVIAVGLAGQEVPGPEHVVRAARDAALADATQPLYRHERAQMRIGDLRDAKLETTA